MLQDRWRANRQCRRRLFGPCFRRVVVLASWPWSRAQRRPRDHGPPAARRRIAGLHARTYGRAGGRGPLCARILMSASATWGAGGMWLKGEAEPPAPAPRVRRVRWREAQRSAGQGTVRLYGARVSLSWTPMDALCRGTARWTGANSLDSVGVTPAAGGGFRSSDQLFYGSLAVLGFLLIQSLSSGFVVSCSTTPSVCLTCCGAEALRLTSGIAWE